MPLPPVDPPVSRPDPGPPGSPPPPDLGPLERLLGAVRWRARAWIWVESCGWLAVAAGLWFWGTLAADRLIEPPGWARGLLGALAAVGGGWLCWRLFGRLAADLSDAALAAVIERRHPEFHDSLSTAIGLAGAAARPATDGDEADRRIAYDDSLLARTTAEAARLARRVRPGPLFRRRRLLVLAGCGAMLAGTVGWLATVRPDIAGLWSRRLLALSDEPWPRRVTLEAEGFDAGVRTVARGSDVEVLVAARAAGSPPQFVELRWLAPGGWRSERMGTRGTVAAGADAAEVRQTFGHVLKGVSHDTPLEIRGGDARLQNLLVRVVDPPVVTNLAITYERPDYLGGGRRTAAAARVVRMPRGSLLEIEATASKPLAAAELVVRTGGSSPAGAAAGERTVAELPAPGETVLSGRAGPVDADMVVSVRLTDADGIGNREPIELLISAIPDEPPRVAVRPRGIATAVTPLARVPLEGSIADDHGLAAAGVRVSVVSPRSSASGPTFGAAAAESEAAAGPLRLPIARVTAGATVVEFSRDDPEFVALEPLGLTVGGRVEMVVEAHDACTLDARPNVGTSEVWSFEVVSPESLRSLLEAREVLLRRRFESVIADLAQARDRLREAVSAAGDPPGARPEQAVEGPADTPDAGMAGSRTEPDGRAAVRRLGEAAARAGGETGEIAEAFLGIRLELDNNRLLTPEVEHRLVAEIAGPLMELAAGDLPQLAARAAGRAAIGTGGAAETAGSLPTGSLLPGGSDQLLPSGSDQLLREADELLLRLRAVLDRMMELESFNEVIERLRGVIRLQEEIRDQTLDEHKKRAREALGGS
jgi:hypothetical protein